MREFELRVGLAALVVFGALAASGCASTPSWTESTVSIEAEGAIMDGDQFKEAAWVGTGFWIDHRLLATNAHVATRALRLVGVDDDGNKYHFDTIMALDRAGDIAILRADREGDKEGVTFIDKPEHPKDLRGREIMMVGNSGARGLGFFDGRVTNVLGDPGEELILHNATVVGGSSGSAIYDKDEHKVMGIHHSAAYDTKFATPSWRVQAVIAAARKAAGVPLGQLFTLPNIMRFADIWGQREFCLAPGQAYKVPFDAPRATDILTYVKPVDPTAVLHAYFVRGAELPPLWKAAIKGPAYLAFSLTASGPHQVVVIAPEGGPPKICGVIGVGGIDWEKGIR